MPPRITEKSNRPRVSDRTMVANLATTTLVRFKKTKGVATITSMKPLGMGIRCLAAGARGPKTINITGTVAHRAGGWMHESIRGRPAGGEKCLLTSPFIGLALRVAVGTAVTRCPPHRPVLALLVHTVPTLDVWRRSARWDMDVRYGLQEAGQPAAPESAPRSNGSVDSAAEAGAAITAAHLSETPSVDARCPVRRDIGNTPSPQTATTSGCPRWTRACAGAASP